MENKNLIEVENANKEMSLVTAILERIRTDMLGMSQVSDESLRKTAESWIDHLLEAKIPVDSRLMKAYSSCMVTSENSFIGLPQIITERRKMIERDAIKIRHAEVKQTFKVRRFTKEDAQ